MPKGFFIRSKETIKHLKKLSDARKGKPPWNKGIPHTEETKRKIGLSSKGRFFSKEARKNMSEAKKGKVISEETKKKMSETNKGQVRSSETKENISKSLKGKRSGKNNGNWKGGITPLREIIRANFLYRQWRSDVFTRDNFTCQKCRDKTGGNLEAHHLKHLSSILEEYKIKTIEKALACEELWNINNGITLCELCHDKKSRYIDEA